METTTISGPNPNPVLHVDKYGGRELWVGDDVRLFIPTEPRASHVAPRSDASQ